MLTKTARWKIGTTLVEVVKAIVEHIDHPDIDYAVNVGKFIRMSRVSIRIWFFFLFHRNRKRIHGTTIRIRSKSIGNDPTLCFTTKLKYLLTEYEFSLRIKLGIRGVFYKRRNSPSDLRVT